MESVGFKFDNQIDSIWDDKFELLKEFISEHGRFPKRDEIYKDTKIGQWCYFQRQYYKNGKLCEDKINKLQSIEFKFNNQNDSIWDDKFELLKEFISEHGRFPKSRESYKDIRIGQWCSDQRQFYKNGKLSEDRIKKLESIEFKFNKN